MKSGNLLGTIYNTPIGGVAVWMINKTGALSKKGTLVDTGSSVDFSFSTSEADDPDVIGAVWDNDIPDGALCRIVFSGIADVLLEDNSASTHGNWARSSITQAGRADITNTEPPGEGIPEADAHFKEIGHSTQSVIAGTDKLSRIFMHLN